jgi:hypothetical protein
MLNLALILIGILICTISAFYNNAGMTILAGLVSACGAIKQYLDTKPFEQDVQISSWKAAGHEFVVSFARREHRKSSPITRFYLPSAHGHEEAMCDVVVSAERTVSLRAAKPCIGRIVIN